VKDLLTVTTFFFGVVVCSVAAAQAFTLGNASAATLNATAVALRMSFSFT
jgi:hypothetical protein